MFLMRYQDSNFVIAKVIELSGKAFGVTDPSKYPSVSTIYRLRTKVGQKLDTDEILTKFGQEILLLAQNILLTKLGQNVDKMWTIFCPSFV